MTTRIETSAPSNPKRWGACGILLSMDCMQALVRPMGLELDAKSLKDAVREAVIAGRSNFEQGSTVPEFPMLLLDSLRSHLGENATEHFLSWLAMKFSYSVDDHKPWRRWYSAFFRFAGNSKAWSQLGLPLGCSTRLYESYLRIMFQADIWGIWKDARSHVLSAWDLEMYAIHEFDDDDPKDPFNWVVLTYETRSFREFWAEVRSTLTEQELIVLWQRLKDDPNLSPTDHLRSLPDPFMLPNEDAA